MKRKNVLFVCSVFYPEPIVSAHIQTDLAMKLAEKYKVTVLRPIPTRPKGFHMPEYDYSSFPFKVIEINSYTSPASRVVGRFRESISHGLCCAKYIRRHHNEIDFIYNDSWHLFGLYLVAKAANKYGISYITPVQDIYPESLASKLPDSSIIRKLVIRLLSPIDHYTLSNARLIQTNSEKMADYLCKTRHLDKIKFLVVRNWQDEREFVDYNAKRIDRSEDTPFTFMYMGNVGPLAGIEVLFNAFELADLKGARLVIAGSGPAKESLQQKATRYYHHIEFWDVPSGKVPETQAQADVLLLPVKKGFAKSSVPSKLIAYLFSAKPVIASVDLDSDTSTCILESDSGWVTEPEDVLALATCMRHAFNISKHHLARKGSNGFDYAMKVFSRKKNLEILSCQCDEIINTQR